MNNLLLWATCVVASSWFSCWAKLEKWLSSAKHIASKHVSQFETMCLFLKKIEVIFNVGIDHVKHVNNEWVFYYHL